MSTAESLAIAAGKSASELNEQLAAEARRTQDDLNKEARAEERKKEEAASKVAAETVKEIKGLKVFYNTAMTNLTGKVNPGTFSTALKSVNRMVSPEALSDREYAVALKALESDIATAIKRKILSPFGKVPIEMINRLKDIANRVYKAKSSAITDTAVPAPAVPSIKAIPPNSTTSEDILKGVGL
jgi:hypothetical protein